MLKFSSLKIDGKDSRYGPIEIVPDREKNLVKVVQEGYVVSEFVSILPHYDAQRLAAQCYHKDKMRLYCNKPLIDLVPSNLRFFYINDERQSIFFHNSRSLKISGNVLRSGQKMELSFLAPHELWKKKQARRIRVLKMGEKIGSDVYVIEFTYTSVELISWSDRNYKIEDPAVTIR
ncbi:hypothetical protein AU106_gp162 [Sinorhizobium phage phiM9]|uniref:Uncharacterized protein n=1 Tax=Sinorhizobium phage phiM9 TaxID=1636182 RepID=A0A0F6R7M3_9CAUD|nr:hypothetical protein AU106_gp162 [Sinorhizobium phage phiM9]AKE44793.1 hypothetical protein Sm_phiM9_165 [Sinorhizobium phage phiM9]